MDNMDNLYTPDTIYTNKPLDNQIDADKLMRIFKTTGATMRWVALITSEYERAINKGKAYVTITYEYAQYKHRYKPVIQISDTNSQDKLERIIKRRVCTTRRRTR